METTPGKDPGVIPRAEASALLERETELALIDAALSAAEDGSGSLLLLEGPAGIGKSRLLSAARVRARERGLEVLSARGGELERDFAHGVVRQLFEALVVARPDEERRGLLAGAAGLAAPLFALADRPPTPAGDEAPFQTLHGLYWLTANIAERRPLLVQIDDLHWCDAPSLRFLAYLARRLDGMPIAVVASVRTGEPVADAAALAELEAEPLARVARPRALSRGATDLLLAAVLDREPAPAFTSAVHDASGGNPLLLSALVQEVRASGTPPDADAADRVRQLAPAALGRAVLQRIRRLGTAAEALARAVAVLGEEAALPAAAALAVLDADEALAAAAALGRAEVLRTGASLRFAHPLLRSAVLGDLDDHERALAHERAAELLTLSGAPATRVAVHLLGAAPRARAAVVDVLRRAAERARAEGAADAARVYLERALAEPPPAHQRAEVLLELGLAELRASAPGAIAHLEEADDLMAGHPRSAEATLALAGSLYAAGRQGEGAAALLRAMERNHHEREVMQRLDAQLIGWARYEGDLYPMARERLARAAPEASEDDFGGAFLLVLAASELARAGESPDRARRLVDRGLSGGLLPADETWQGYAIAVAVLVTLDDLEAAARRYTEWVERARRDGLVFAFARASSFRALALLRMGALAEAEADARAALDAVAPLAGPGGHPDLLGFLAEILLERGRPAEAGAVLDLAPMADGERPTFQSTRWFEVRARVRMALGEVDSGLADLLAVGERLEAFGVRNPSHSAWRSHAALALLARGDADRARALAAEEVDLARRWGAPRPLSGALRAAGLIEGGAAGLRLLRESAAVLAGSPARLERARSLTALGAALRRSNHRHEARDVLADALELARRCGADPVAERAHEELLATGARPRRLVRTGLDALTPSERRVAAMAAEGQTNREVAQALFVTAKTVEMHLSSVYRKLGITARSQLPRAIGER